MDLFLYYPLKRCVPVEGTPYPCFIASLADFKLACLLRLGDTEELAHLQAFDLRPLILQLGLQLTDLGLLTAHKRLFYHGLFLEL